MKSKSLLLFLLFLLSASARSQSVELVDRPFLLPADTFDQKRFWVSTGVATGIYTGISIGLWNAWYRDYPTGGFRTFNDSGEWLDLDKVGHFGGAWKEAIWLHHALRWTGMDRRKAMWAAAGGSVLLQGTIEIMDGFSQQWGFSWYDMGANLAGTGLFIAQEIAWEDQRIKVKVSNSLPTYPDLTLVNENGATTQLRDRAEFLYGRGAYTRFVKDYNGQTMWITANPHSFLPESKLPKWLNIAVGYGGANMYGGYGNTWSVDGERFSLDSEDFPRHRQLFLSLDVDLERIPVRNRGLKFALGLLNFIKIPAPTLELTRRNGVRFHPVYW